MMITKTNKFKIKIDTPFTDEKGSIYINDRNSAVNAEEYPDVFEQMYELEDGTEVCLGDPIWRSKNYEVRSTRFNLAHISQNTPIFGTRVNCEKWLETNARNIKAELLKQNSDSSFNTLEQLINKLKKYEELSYKEIGQIQESMVTCVKNIKTFV